jgi:predicted RNA binding protein YcfA (HicA-like mRNA interferase family)
LQWHFRLTKHEPTPPRCQTKKSWALYNGGFYIHHSTGSHHILKHPDKPELRVTVAMHNKDLKRKTLSSIVDQAGYTTEEFIELL